MTTPSHHWLTPFRYGVEQTNLATTLWLTQQGNVYDGDTIRVQRNDEELKIRLCCIDAPEKDPQFDIKSRDYLRSLIDQGIEDGRLIVLPVEHDCYSRTVAEIFVPMVDTEEEIHLTSY